MKAIKRKNAVWAALTSLGIGMGVLLLVFGGAASNLQAQIALASVMTAGTVAARLWLRESNRLKTARLIADNPILHIRTAVISDLSAETSASTQTIEVIISYFGILLHEKVIKFNQDGIRIRAVEIGADFISFTYGTEKRTQNIRLLRPAIDAAELDQIAERFRYETGITPALLS